jgi:tRNA (guanine37-N1)-methyltransferase
VFEGEPVPEVLLSGDHAAIAAHRFLESVRLTLARRPELLATVRFTPTETKMLGRAGLRQQIEAIGRENG